MKLLHAGLDDDADDPAQVEGESIDGAHFFRAPPHQTLHRRPHAGFALGDG
jgi:hypothetical protein